MDEHSPWEGQGMGTAEVLKEASCWAETPTVEQSESWVTQRASMAIVEVWLASAGAGVWRVLLCPPACRRGAATRARHGPRGLSSIFLQ